MIRALLDAGAIVEWVEPRVVKLRLDKLQITVYDDNIAEIVLIDNSPYITWRVTARTRVLNIGVFMTINSMLKQRILPTEVDNLQRIVKILLLSDQCTVESFDGKVIQAKEGSIRWTIRQHSLRAAYSDNGLHIELSSTYPSLVMMDRLRHLLQEVVRHAQVAMGSAQAYGTRGTGRSDNPLSTDRQDAP